MNDKSRIEFFDFAKGIAILSIIIGHLGLDSINRFVFTYHVPVFFIISGCFISKKSNVYNFAKNKFKRLMIPYFVTCIVIISLGTLAGYIHGNGLGELYKWILASVYGSGIPYSYPFRIYSIGAIWFLPSLFFGSIFLRTSFEFKENVRIVFILLLFFVGYYSSELFFWFPLSIQAGACCSLYLYVGWRYKEYFITRIDSESKLFVFLCAVVLWISFIINYNGFSMVKNNYGRGIIDIISSIASSWIIIVVSRYLSTYSRCIKKFILFFGKHSLIILCVHIIELNLFPWHRAISLFVGISDHYIDILLVFLKPLILFGISWILIKCPLIKKIFFIK